MTMVIKFTLLRTNLFNLTYLNPSDLRKSKHSTECIRLPILKFSQRFQLNRGWTLEILDPLETTVSTDKQSMKLNRRHKKHWHKNEKSQSVSCTLPNNRQNAKRQTEICGKRERNGEKVLLLDCLFQMHVKWNWKKRRAQKTVESPR